jgi:hypothetical protein
MKPVFVASAAVQPFGKHRDLPAAELGYRAVPQI